MSFIFKNSFPHMTHNFKMHYYAGEKNKLFSYRFIQISCPVFQGVV